MAGLAALQYSQDGFDTRTGTMMGRRMAGETFLRAWIEHSGADPLTVWLDAQEREAFAAQAERLGATMPIAFSGNAQLKPLVDAGALWLADPSLAPFAWARRWTGQAAWSLVGITHTISSHAAMDRISELLVAPVQRWDALICTSRAARSAVMALLEAQGDYLKARLGATACSGPELPVIPLGVDCDALTPDPDDRARWRAELGIPDDAVAVLQFGRISYHSKAHPLPLYQALCQAKLRGVPRLHLILAGQPTNPTQAGMIRELAAAFEHEVTTHIVDGARADAGSVRAAADIGTLLSDNIQESFGLAPVELMAAGLPVVGSDWNGLRDTIVHDETGLLVPTIGLPASVGDPIARRFAFGFDTYGAYIAAVAQTCSVDVRAAADAFAALAADPDRRARMGAAAHMRARTLYDWPVIIHAYRALLRELEERRRAGLDERAPRLRNLPAQPARMNPLGMFASYPTAVLGADDRLDLAVNAIPLVAALPGGVENAIVAPLMLPNSAMLDAILQKIAGGGVTVAQVLDAFPESDRRLTAMGLGFLLKMGLVVRL